MKSHPPESFRRGFTLLEVVLALLIATAVMTSIFVIARGSMQTTTVMVDYQNEAIANDAFFSMLTKHFESLPGNAVMDLRATNSAEPYTSELTFQNVPVSFNWGGMPIAAEATRIITVPTINKGLDIVLEYYDQQILDDEEEGTLAERGIEPIAEITLLRDVRLFEWYVLDGRNYRQYEDGETQWPHEWDQATRRPTFVQLKVIFGVDDAPVSRMFWIPTKTNPRTVMTQMQNQARSNRSTPGGNPGEGGNGPVAVPPSVRPPTGTPGGSPGGTPSRPSGSSSSSVSGSAPAGTRGGSR
ncbi:MAG: PulJ/GspJ family protein [Akkermansiaceae bacterium]